MKRGYNRVIDRAHSWARHARIRKFEGSRHDALMRIGLYRLSRRWLWAWMLCD